METGPIHLIGIGGSGLSALARLYRARGHRVTGSDTSETSTTRALRALGCAIQLGHRAGNVPSDAALAIYSAAVTPDNPERRAAERLGIPALVYAETLGAWMDAREGVAVAGCHGKTTTTAMAAHLFIEAGHDPTVVCGGDVTAWGGNARLGQGPHLIAEACEFQRSFLHLRPRCGVVTNIEDDHLDYYRDLDDIESAFRAFLGGVPASGALVVPIRDERALRAARGLAARRVTFGLDLAADYRASSPEADASGNYRAELRTLHGQRAVLKLGVPGLHNLHNALAAVAAFCECGAGTPAEAARALETFTGVRRRLEVVGHRGDRPLIDDYAHHPTEIAASLAALRGRFPGRPLWVVFQAHQHSRTRLLLDRFGPAFAAADLVMVPPIYAARDSATDRAEITHRLLADRLRSAGRVVETVESLTDAVRRLTDAAPANAVIAAMGAGDVGSVVSALAEPEALAVPAGAIPV